MKLEVYSTMCMTATELQAIKNRNGHFEPYDFVLNKRNNVRLIGLQLIPNKYSQETIWLPTSSQIQELIQILQKDISIIQEDFNHWFLEDKDFYSKKVPNITYDMLWLMYYMERYTRKFWCWGCGYWKPIQYKEQERATRSTARITSYNNENDNKS